MSQITRCPSCTTLFKVVADQLRISEGWVRCGHCQHVFDATLHLQSVPPPSATSSAPDASGTAIEEAPAAAAVSPASSAVANSADDPWEIPLPPPPAAATPEDTASAAPEVLDFAAPELALELDLPATANPTPAAIPASLAVPAPPASPNSAASVELDWPEEAPPAPPPHPLPCPQWLQPCQQRPRLYLPLRRFQLLAFLRISIGLNPP
jgi:predicted Zn finger-like uncharacterized protein